MTAVLHQLAFRVLVVKLAVVGGDQLGDVAERQKVGDGRVEHPLALDVVPHSPFEQLVNCEVLTPAVPSASPLLAVRLPGGNRCTATAKAIGGGVLSRVYRGGLVRPASVPGCVGQAVLLVEQQGCRVVDLVQRSPAASNAPHAAVCGGLNRKSAGRGLLGEPGQNRGGLAIERSLVPAL